MSRSAVVTLTASGAIDATYRVATLVQGGFTRAGHYSREVTGKGVNLSAALTLTSLATAAVVVLGEDDLVFAQHSEHARILRPVVVPGATRVNTSIIDNEGVTTKVNAPTPPLSREAWHGAIHATVTELDALGAAWLVVCGAIPALEGEGSEGADLTELLQAAHDRGVRVGIDTSGPVLERLTRDGSSVSLIKPNIMELAELTDRSLETLGDVVEAARSVIDRGLEIVYVSMGADGVLMVTAHAVVHAYARPARIVNTAGAGDASLAGFLVGLGESGAAEATLADAAATAASWGALAVAQPSTILRHLEGLPLSTVTSNPNRHVRLTEPAAAP